MFEKVNPMHPDKIADRIGGAIVDLGYTKKENPKIAGECLIGHNRCNIIIETDVDYEYDEVKSIVNRIAGEGIQLAILIVPQDEHLAKNQEETIRCGDNGIFKGSPVGMEKRLLMNIAKNIYEAYKSDGKYILDLYESKLVICQSNCETKTLQSLANMTGYKEVIVNPLGNWTGGINVDTGACNRKLGSDMGDAVTGGGIHFKDLSKADVSINVYLHILAQERGEILWCNCAIGDERVYIRNQEDIITEIPYEEVVKRAKEYIDKIGGFEKLAEWGLIR